MLSSINLMIKRLLPIALATSIPAACAYPSISEIKNPPAVDVAVNVEKAVPIEVVKKSGSAQDVITMRNMSCKNSKKKPRSQIVTHLLRSWETLNQKATSIPTYAREGLEFLTAVAIGVGMVLFSGPQ
jgi:uncharacterized lipoprotein YajG